MDFRQRISQFLSQYQTTGWLIALMVGGLLIQLLTYVIFAAIGQPDLYEAVIDGLILPPNFGEWVYQPWSLVTYPFFLSGFDIFSLLFTGFILWTFGRIHQQLLGEQRTRRLVILGIPLIGIVTLIVSTVAGYQYAGNDITMEEVLQEQTSEVPVEAPAEEDIAELPTETPDQPAEVTEDRGNILGRKDLAYVSGLLAVTMILVISCITLVPDYPVQMFLLGQVKIVWVGAVLFLLAWGLNALFITPVGIAILTAGLIGFLHVYLLRKGTDITEVIWSYYSDGDPKPRMKVKYGTKTPKTRSKPSQAKQTDPNSIPQEVIDGILDKISEKGYDSLSREEKELLFKASSQKEDERD